MSKPDPDDTARKLIAQALKLVSRERFDQLVYEYERTQPPLSWLKDAADRFRAPKLSAESAERVAASNAALDAGPVCVRCDLPAAELDADGVCAGCRSREA